MTTATAAAAAAAEEELNAKAEEALARSIISQIQEERCRYLPLILHRFPH